jgi:hypothetical protein
MTTQLLHGSRRLFVMGAAALAAAGLARRNVPDALADEAGEARRSRAEALELLEGYGFLWKATSPATRLDDEATILFTNRGEAAVDIWVNTIIMDHSAHHNERVIDEVFTLAVGESRSVYAVNAYGQADHFSTRIAAGAGDPLELGVEVTIIDGSGTETASFNELAFWIRSYDEVVASIEDRRRERTGANDHEGH